MTQESISEDDTTTSAEDKHSLEVKKRCSSLDKDVVISDDDYAEKSSPYKMENALRSRLKTMGLWQIVIALICIAISIPLHVKVQRSSSGSGLWCPLFFMVMGGISCTRRTSRGRFMAVAAFAVAACQFGVAMIALEGLEIWVALMDNEPSWIVIALNGALMLLAAIEIVLTGAAMLLRWSHRRKTLKGDPRKKVRFEKDDEESPKNIVRVFTED